LGVGQDFGAILGDDQGDIQIEDLAFFKPGRSVVALRQGAAVDGQYTDDIGFGDRLQGGTDMAVLTTRRALPLGSA